MLPTPPPFPYQQQTVKACCDCLSTVLHPWAYPAGLLQCHWVSASPFTAHTTVTRHSHRFYEGFVILGGQIQLITPWETHGLEAGSLVLLSPGSVHQWQTHDQPCDSLVLSFDLDHPVATPSRQTWPVCPEILWIIQLLFDTVERATPAWSLRANSYLGVLYAALISLIETPATTKPVIDTTPQLVTRVDELLRAHLATVLTLDELAAHVSMSTRHLTRCFRAYTGMTIHARLDALRMERAAQLLRRTNLPVAEIAQAIGITNAAYFAQRFRQRFDATPHIFRQRGSDASAPGQTA